MFNAADRSLTQRDKYKTVQYVYPRPGTPSRRYSGALDAFGIVYGLADQYTMFNWLIRELGLYRSNNLSTGAAWHGAIFAPDQYPQPSNATHSRSLVINSN